MTYEVTEKPFRWWIAVRDAVRGTDQDYTVGPVGRSVILLAIPMVLETLMESVFAVVDVFFVARLGPAAVATVGLTESMFTLIYTVALGLSIGVMAMVSRRTGEKDPREAGHTAAQAVLLAVAVAVVVGVLGVVFASDLLALFGANEEVIETGSSYMRVMMAGNVTVLLLFLINAAFRGAGDAVIAMRVLWLANGINVFLDPALIFGWGPFPELGLVGAAVATNIGRGTAVLVQLYVLGTSTRRLKVEMSHWKIDLGIMRRLFKLSATGMLQVFIGMVSWAALVRIVATFGSGALAGYTIGIRLIIFAILPSWGMANAAATMVGQSLGAKDPDRAERSVWIAGFYNMVFLGLVGIVFVFFDESIIGFFTDDPLSHYYGVTCLRVVSLGFVFYAYGLVLTESFNGAGDVWTPTVINFFIFWVFQLPAAWVLAHTLDLGPMGAFIALTVAFSTLAVVSGMVFKLGRWKLKNV